MTSTTPFERHNGWVQTHVLADKASLSGIRRMIRAEFTRVKADPSLAFDCLVAVTEACSNALLQGIDHREDGWPQLSWKIDRESAYFCVQDCSTRGWARAAHPARGQSDSREEEERVHDLGLELVRGLMDDVSIEVGPAGTTVSLTKRLR